MAELIVALDVPSPEAVPPVLAALGETVGFYKIGLELFCAGGPAVVQAVAGTGKRIFLDLKLHDIPRTVERAVASCLKFGVELLTLHASGSKAMIAAAAQAVREAGSGTRLLAVTVLTSMDQSDLDLLGVTRPMQAQVAALGTMAIAAGAHGLVCSPQEVAALRRALGPEPWLVTPGVRPVGGDVGDQKRVATPGQAIRDGSTHLVIGRPILGAADKRAAAEAIRAEMKRA